MAWYKLKEIEKENAENLDNLKLFEIVVKEGYEETIEKYKNDCDLETNEEIDEHIEKMKKDGWITIENDKIIMWADGIE